MSKLNGQVIYLRPLGNSLLPTQNKFFPVRTAGLHVMQWWRGSSVCIGGEIVGIGSQQTLETSEGTQGRKPG